MWAECPSWTRRPSTTGWRCSWAPSCRQLLAPALEPCARHAPCFSQSIWLRRCNTFICSTLLQGRVDCLACTVCPSIPEYAHSDACTPYRTGSRCCYDQNSGRWTQCRAGCQTEVSACLQLERAHSITVHLRSREFPTYAAQAETARVLAALEHLAQMQLGSNVSLSLVERGFPDNLVRGL